MTQFGTRLLAFLWGAITLEFRSPAFVAHGPACVKSLEATVRGNAA